jgi:hypothetical protein
MMMGTGTTKSRNYHRGQGSGPAFPKQNYFPQGNQVHEDREKKEVKKMEKINIVRSKSGLPCLWESGGGYSNTGYAQVISSKDGAPKRPIYIRQRGTLANGDHSLIPVEVGDYVVVLNHHRGDFEAKISRVIDIGKDEAELEPVAVFSSGEWDREPDDSLWDAILAARDKATCYHCREPHFIAAG